MPDPVHFPLLSILSVIKRFFEFPLVLLLSFIFLNLKWLIFFVVYNRYLKTSEMQGIENFVTIMFIIFWDFFMVEQIFLLVQVKRSVVISNKLVHIVASRVAKHLKTSNLRKFGNFRKISKLHIIIT